MTFIVVHPKFRKKIHTLYISNTAFLLSGGRVAGMLQYEMNPFLIPAAIIIAKAVVNIHIYTDLFAATDSGCLVRHRVFRHKVFLHRVFRLRVFRLRAGKRAGKIF